MVASVLVRYCQKVVIDTRLNEVKTSRISMFDELPTELVERILAFLSYEEKVAVLGVCQR